MAQEEDTKQIPDLTLVPICCTVDCRSTGHWCDLICVRLDPDPRVVLDTEQVVDDLKSLTPERVVCTGDVHHGPKLSLRVVSQKSQRRDDGRWVDVEGELVLDDGELLDVLGQA